MNHGRRLFPVGLYATLLVGIGLLAAPDALPRVEGALRAAITLPLRAWTNVIGAGADAADDDAPRRELVQALLARERRAAISGGPGHAATLVPVACRVIGGEHRGGGRAGQPSVLRLDRTLGELPRALPHVTHGDALVGTLAAGEADATARVVLLHDQVPGAPPRRIPARAELGGDELLRFLVEPAGTIDPWPLRCTLLSDPYRVARPLAARVPVLTDPLAGDPFGTLPAGLQLGTLELWGYARQNVVIGLYVKPARDPRLVASVVVWCQEEPRHDRLPDPLASGSLFPVKRTTIVARGRERWFLTCHDFAPPVGAAVVRGHALVGLVESAGPGHALAAPLGERAPAAFLLLPDDGSAPLALEGSLRSWGADLILTVAGAEPPRAGTLFSGAGAPSCPAGLVIGRALPLPGADAVLRIERAAAVPGPGLLVFVAGASR